MPVNKKLAEQGIGIMLGSTFLLPKGEEVMTQKKIVLHNASKWLSHNTNDGDPMDGCHSTIHTLSSHELNELVHEMLVDMMGD